MDIDARKSLMEWEPVSSRIIRARFYSKYVKTTLLQCYAPTEPADKEAKNELYNLLQEQISRVPKHDILIVMGDMNAKVGLENKGYESCIGKFGLGDRNNNGERFLDFCRENNMVIWGTLFQHKDIHKTTWTSPDGKTTNQIDHMAIGRKWRTSLHYVRAIRGADVNSDHHLVLGKLQLKLRRVQRKQAPRPLNYQKLNDLATRESFVIELSNRFHVLSEN